MRKTFHEILAEQDEEFTYRVKSVVDIHKPEYFERVRHALMPYRIKDIATDSITPLSRNNKTFPDQPNTPTYGIKVVTGLPIDTKAATQAMAMVCHIHASHLKILPEDDVASNLPGKPHQTDKTTAQLLVGTKRIGEFVKDLQKDRKDREKKTITREVYESFVTTHRGLENVIKKPVLKGYYFVEMSRDEDSNYLRAEGPFPARPDGNHYRDRIGAKSLELLEEKTIGGSYSVQVLVERIDGQDVSDQMFQVGVSDMTSGRRFTSMVRAATPEIAREMAVHQVAEANRIDPSGLTAMAPKPANG